MKEVRLNDKCMHCNNRECHDGYNFCNQAMKENSFYKNAKLYKGLEVIHRPTYEELEKENAELKSRECWKSCEYANPKSELIAQHIQDVQNLTKAKEIIKTILGFMQTFGYSPSMDKFVTEAEQFISEVEK